MDLTERIASDFTYHTPTPDMLPVFADIRNEAKLLALYIAEHVPAGREQALALTKLEEAVMWANAGVARAG